MTFIEERVDENQLRKKADEIVNSGEGSPDALSQFAGTLVANGLLSEAAQILRLALSKIDHVEVDASQTRDDIEYRLALATFKMERGKEDDAVDLPFNDILEITNRILLRQEAPEMNKDACVEIYGLQGVVYRRSADVSGDTSFLHRAVDCYRRCHEYEKQSGNFSGYGAANAACLLDRLAVHYEGFEKDKPSIAQSAALDARRQSAILRREIIDELNAPTMGDVWRILAIAEAHLGLGLRKLANELAGEEVTAEHNPKMESLDAAKSLIDSIILELKCQRWVQQPVYMQWLQIARNNAPSEADNEANEGYWDSVAHVMNHFRMTCGYTELSAARDIQGVATRGKVGLALSGGGFRASIFHIGVLARLAEADVLRHIEVISTVSGGSIIGAHYYILLRELLEAKENPSREDYIALVKKLDEQFSTVIQQNLRMRGLSNPLVMLKLLFWPNYTRSDRMAELYDEYVFSPAIKSTAPIELASLKIVPKGEDEEFDPRRSNWRRTACVPELLINASCLNTGHCWQFTRDWMGEPAELIGRTFDKNERIGPIPYNKSRYGSLSLGFAVAASACVPGIFEPIRLSGLYPDKLIRLVDGGVHDNQGVDALVGSGCNLILCSDASGQLPDLPIPPNGPVGTPKRSMDMLMKRVRDAQHSMLVSRAHSEPNRGLFFVHLKSDQIAQGIGRDAEIRQLLSNIRTDLDSFSEVEACTLKAFGYRVAEAELLRLDARSRAGLGRAWACFDLNTKACDTWAFLKIEQTMSGCEKTDAMRRDLVRQLNAGSGLFLKPFKLISWLVPTTTIGVIAGLLLADRLNVGALMFETFSINYFSMLVSAFVFAVTISVPSIRVWCFESSFTFIGLIASNLYFVLGLNRVFLKRGALDRLLRMR